MPISADSAAGREGLLPFWCAAAVAAAIVAGDLATRRAGQSLTHEGGGVETASAVMYLFAAALWVVRRPAAEWRRGWQVPAVLMLMAGREFDFDKRFTSVGLLKSNLYLTNEAPLPERLLGVAAVALLVVVGVRLLMRDARPFLRGLRSGDASAWAVAIGLAAAGFAKSIDGLARKLEPFGITVDDTLGARLGAAEEIVELAVPLLFVFAIARAAPRRPRS